MLDVTAISHVSRWWRDAALGASELWLNVHIGHYGTKHASVLLEHFRRSQGRPISLEIRFTAPTTPPQLHAFLKAVVQPHLWRCCSLSVQATRPNWDAISATFGQETYPQLRTLDIMALHTYITANPQPNPTNELTFVLPSNHPLEELSTHAMNVGVALPCIRVLRVGGPLGSLVGADGHVNRWLLDGPQRLELCSLVIPPMHFQTGEERSAGTSSVVHLKLSRMYASRSLHGTQNDCAPFFDALQTPLIRTLELESFHGRVWEDWLFALNTPIRKYPLLTTLRLKELNFQKLSYAGVGFFLGCFPGIESLVFVGCPAATWESAVHVLMLHPELCPSVSAVEVNGVLLAREEPLPFASCLLEERRVLPGRFLMSEERRLV